MPVYHTNRAVPIPSNRPQTRHPKHEAYPIDHVAAPKMTKKQFEYVAFLLAKTRPTPPARWSSDMMPVGKAKKLQEFGIPVDAVAAWERVVAEFTHGLSSTNTQFNPKKFREAVVMKIQSQEDER